MKKFMKFLSIILLVGLSIGGTCYFFYKNLVKQQDAYANINTFLYSAEKSSVDYSSNEVNIKASNKLSLPIATSEMLDSITKLLNTYMIISLDYGIDNNSIIDRLEYTIEKRDELSRNNYEFILKSTDEDFNRLEAVNYNYRTYASYLVRYAEAVKFINKEIKTNIINDVNVDIKYDIIELYCLTVIDTFSNIDSTGDVIVNDININLLNDKLAFKDGYIVVASTAIGDELSYLNNKFIYSYNNLDKENFVSELADSINNATELSDTSSHLEMASFYLKKILGL